MLPDWVSNPGPLTYESSALLTVLRSPAFPKDVNMKESQGSAAPRSHSSFGDEGTWSSDIIMQALNLLENNIICST